MIIASAAAWRPKAVESADLVRGYRAAKTLQALQLPPSLDKALASYLLRAGTELASRGVDAESVTRDGQ